LRTTQDCHSCPARTRGPFRCLDDARLARLGIERVTQHYTAGQVVFYEYAPSLAVYCVREGEIKLWRAGMHGETHVLGTRSVGDLVGCRAVLAGVRYSASAEALRPSVLCVVPRESFLELVRDDGPLAFELLRRMSEVTIVSEQDLVARSLESVRQRVARHLLRLVPDGAVNGSGPVELRDLMSRSEMADLVGTTPETLSRTLHGWMARGILDVGRGVLVLRNLDALRRQAGNRG